MKVPAKIKHFCWRAINGVHPTKINLQKREIQIPVNCPVCHIEAESEDHVIFECRRAQEIWKLTFNHEILETDFNQSFADRRWLKLSMLLSMEDLQLVATTCWAIWVDRNKLDHGNQIPSQNVRSNWIQRYLTEYMNANRRTSGASLAEPNQNAQAPCWIPPKPKNWKINVDAAWYSSSSLGGFRNNMQKFNGRGKRG